VRNQDQSSAFFTRPSTVGIPLRDYLSLSEDNFRVLFRNSPIKRIKRRGFLRNVCVALGNVGDPSDLAALERAAANPEPLIAEHAKWAIHQIRYRHQISASHWGTAPGPHPGDRN
jgi:epoxyqueuosine reductase